MNLFSNYNGSTARHKKLVFVKISTIINTVSHMFKKFGQKIFNAKMSLVRVPVKVNNEAYVEADLS